MVQATTPTIIMNLPNTVDLTQAQTIVFTMTQGSTVIKKVITDASEQQVSVYLTQDDTLGLSNGIAQIQLNWTYSDNSRACTNIVNINVTPNLLKAVI